MTSLSKGKILGYALAIFVAGAVTGGSVAIGYTKEKYGRPPEQVDFRKRVEERFQERLHLTPEQMVKIKPILDQLGQEFGKIHRESMQRVEETSKVLNAQIETYLTDAQKEEFRKMQAERREWRGKRGGGKGDDRRQGRDDKDKDKDAPDKGISPGDKPSACCYEISKERMRM